MKTCICLQNPISFVCLLNHHNSPIPLTDLQHQDSHFPSPFTQHSEFLQVKKNQTVKSLNARTDYLHTPDVSSWCLLGYFSKGKVFSTGQLPFSRQRATLGSAANWIIQ